MSEGGCSPPWRRAVFEFPSQQCMDLMGIIQSGNTPKGRIPRPQLYYSSHGQAARCVSLDADTYLMKQQNIRIATCGYSALEPDFPQG